MRTLTALVATREQTRGSNGRAIQQHGHEGSASLRLAGSLGLATVTLPGHRFALPSSGRWPPLREESDALRPDLCPGAERGMRCAVQT